MNRYELHQCAAAPNEEMRRYPNPLQTGQGGMRLRIERAHEELLDRIGRKAPGWQADCMDHDQFDPDTRRTRIGMRRSSLPGTGVPAIRADSSLGPHATDRGPSVTHCMSRRCIR